jgi:phosphatidylglycerophosphatase A
MNGDRLALGVATLGGAGYSPIVPGTAGTLVSLPFVVAAAAYLPRPAYALVTLAVSGLGVWAADRAARALRLKDPGPVVIDEAAGLLVTLAGVPVTWLSAVLAFFLFRAMDILKPPPARQAEALPGGWGIMIDDLFAGVYANLLLRGALLLAARAHLG